MSTFELAFGGVREAVHAWESGRGRELLALARACEPIVSAWPERFTEVVAPYIGALGVPIPLITAPGVAPRSRPNPPPPTFAQLERAAALVPKGGLGLDLRAHHDVAPLLASCMASAWWGRVVWLDLSETSPGQVLLEVTGALAPEAHLVLVRAGLSRLKLSGIRLTGADLRGADLGRTDLTRARLERADLRGARFDYARMGRAFLTGSRADGASFLAVDLREAYLTGLVAISARQDPDTMWPHGWDASAHGVLSHEASRQGYLRAHIEAALGTEYELIEELDEGGAFGTWSVREVASGHMRLAFISNAYWHDQNLRYTFVKSAWRLARLPPHPACLAITDYSYFRVDRGAPSELFAISQRPEGVSLRAILDDIEYMGERVAIDITLGICDALAHALAHGVHHGSLTTRRVFVRSNTRQGVEVQMFAQDLIHEEVDRQSPHRNRHGICFGTPEYHSPERAQALECDESVDIYVMGVMLYEMLVGEHPYASDSPVKILTRHVFEPIPNAHEVTAARVSQPTGALITRALAKQPGDRFEDLGAFMGALEQIQSACP